MTDIPLKILNNPKAMKLWENATDEEKDAGIILSEFQFKAAKSGITDHYDLSDKWNSRFPKKEGKSYTKEKEIVKKGAKLAGISASTVYTLLKTTRFYTRKDYEMLNIQAQENGVILCWTHLRIIADRLNKKEYRKIKTEIEQAIIQEQLTGHQLHKAIDDAAPETKRTRATTPKAQSLIGIVQQFVALCNRQSEYARILASVEDDEEMEQVEILLGCFGQLGEFITVQTERIEQMRSTVSPIIRDDDIFSEIDGLG